MERIIAAIRVALAVVLIALGYFLVSDAEAQPACWPAQVVGGKGTAAAVRADSNGMAVVWGCSDGFAAGKAGFWGPWSAFVPDWQQKAAEIIAGGESAMAGAWKQYITTNTTCSRTESDPPICAVAIAAWDAATLPPVPMYVVAKNSSYPDRPAYPFVGGARGTKSTSRATVGAPCDCKTRSVEGTSIYCSVNGKPDEVALCRAQ